MYLRPNAILSQIMVVDFSDGAVQDPGPKTEWALQRGGRSAHPFSWLLSSPQQPLETEDPPTVSLAPQYTSQHLCRAIAIFSCSKIHEKSRLLARFRQAASLVNATLSYCSL